MLILLVFYFPGIYRMITKRTITEKLDEEGRVIGRVTVEEHSPETRPYAPGYDPRPWVGAPIVTWQQNDNLARGKTADNCTNTSGFSQPVDLRLYGDPSFTAIGWRDI